MLGFKIEKGLGQNLSQKLALRNGLPKSFKWYFAHLLRQCGIKMHFLKFGAGYLECGVCKSEISASQKISQIGFNLKSLTNYLKRLSC